MSRLVLVALFSTFVLPFVAADPVHVTLGPYGEPCAGLYSDHSSHIIVVCAGKGVVTDHPDDCQAYYDSRFTGKSCAITQFSTPSDLIP